jgi:hypothetical protein
MGPAGKNLFWRVKPDACPFAQHPKQDLSSQGSLEMTASSAGRPCPDQIALIHLRFIDFSILPN